jgi:hypothetical protein
MLPEKTNAAEMDLNQKMAIAARRKVAASFGNKRAKLSGKAPSNRACGRKGSVKNQRKQQSSSLNATADKQPEQAEATFPKDVEPQRVEENPFEDEEQALPDAGRESDSLPPSFVVQELTCKNLERRGLLIADKCITCKNAVDAAG